MKWTPCGVTRFVAIVCAKLYVDVSSVSKLFHVDRI